MFPRIFIYGDLMISSYSLSYSIAIVLGLIIAYKECKRLNLPVHYFPGTAFYGVLSGIIGAKLFDIIFFQWNDFILSPFRTLISGDGWMYYGAEIVGILGGVTYLLVKRQPIFSPLDITALCFMIAHSLGRFGCFLAGCCYGNETSCFAGVIFPGHFTRVHPTQLYESIPLLIAFIFFWSIRKKFVVPGTIFSSYLIFYSTLRFIVEFFRFDAYKYGFLNLSPSQYIALFLFITGFIFLFFACKSFKAKSFCEGKNMTEKTSEAQIEHVG